MKPVVVLNTDASVKEYAFPLKNPKNIKKKIKSKEILNIFKGFFRVV